MPLQSGNHGSTLATAATVEETKMVKFLVQQGVYCGSDGSTLPFLEAVASGARNHCTGIGENCKL